MHGDPEPDCGSEIVWCPAFRRSGPAKAGTPNRRFMESLHDFDAVYWDREPVRIPLNRPPGTFSRTGGEGARRSRTAPPTRCCRRPVGRASLRFLCRQDAGSTLVTRAKWILRMAQCIPAMGAQACARYRAQMPVRPHVAALFLCRSSGLEQVMISGIEPQCSAHSREQRGCVSTLQCSFDSPTYLRIV